MTSCVEALLASSKSTPTCGVKLQQCLSLQENAPKSISNQSEPIFLLFSPFRSREQTARGLKMNVPSRDDGCLGWEDMADWSAWRKGSWFISASAWLDSLVIKHVWFFYSLLCVFSPQWSALGFRYKNSLNSHTDEPSSSLTANRILYRPVVAFYCGSADLYSVCPLGNQKVAGPQGFRVIFWLARSSIMQYKHPDAQLYPVWDDSRGLPTTSQP